MALTHMLTIATDVNLTDVNTSQIEVLVQSSWFRGIEVQRSGLYRSINCSILRRNSPGLEDVFQDLSVCLKF